MCSKNAICQWTLQGGETKHFTPVAFENELHSPVAQPANTVIEHDGEKSFEIRRPLDVFFFRHQQHLRSRMPNAPGSGNPLRI